MYEQFKNQRADAPFVEKSAEDTRKFIEYLLTKGDEYEWPSWFTYILDLSPSIRHILDHKKEKSKTLLEGVCYTAIKRAIYSDNIEKILQPLLKIKGSTFYEGLSSILLDTRAPHLDGEENVNSSMDYNIYSEEVNNIVSTMKAVVGNELPTPALFLYGPPGTGKTSIAASIEEDSTEVSVCRLGSKSVTTQTLYEFLMERSLMDTLLVIDEVDKATDNDIKDLMSFLDKRSRKGALVILTSNKPPEALPQALLRPGRINRCIEIGYLSEDKATILFKNMFSSHWEEAKKVFMEINDTQHGYQPAAIKAMRDNWLTEAVESVIKQDCMDQEFVKKLNEPKIVTLTLSAAFKRLASM